VLTRRGLLLAGGVAAATGCGARRGPTTAAAPTSPSATPLPLPPLPDVEPGPLVVEEFRSAAMLGRRTRWGLTRPPGVAGPLPLVVALHGHGGGVATMFGPDLDLGRYVAAAVADGVPPFALVVANGGNGFWHRQPSGEDSGAMVVDELLPLLDEHPDVEVRVDEVGLLGWSMGGYGVLHLAPLLGPDRVVAVCASSPGLWTDPSQVLRDGFATDAEYARYSVLGRQTGLAGIPVRLACGEQDRFFDAARTYAEGFPADADLEVAWGPGGHELAFTRGSMPDDLAFVASRLPVVA
jgi:enterochelin esterase-like enzyme